MSARLSYLLPLRISVSLESEETHFPEVVLLNLSLVSRGPVPMTCTVRCTCREPVHPPYTPIPLVQKVLLVDTGDTLTDGLSVVLVLPSLPRTKAQTVLISLHLFGMFEKVLNVGTGLNLLEILEPRQVC